VLSWLTAPTYWPFWNKRDAHGKACACLTILVEVWSGRLGSTVCMPVIQYAAVMGADCVYIPKCTWNGAKQAANSASTNFAEMVQVAEIKAIPDKTRCFRPEAVLDRNALSATNSSLEQCEKRWLDFA